MDEVEKREVLRLYFSEHLSQKQISYRLQIDQSNISRFLKKAQEIKGKNQDMRKGGVVTQHLKRYPLWRYHSLHFVVKPYYFYPRYSEIRKKRGNSYIYEGDWKINLHEKEIEFILRRGYDFISKDKYEAISKAEESLNRSLYAASNAYGFEYRKEGRISIKLVKQHLACVNSSLAKARKDQYLKVKDIDGKIWLLIDRSKGLPEHELVDSGRVLADSEIVNTFLNDLRNNPDITMSKLFGLEVRNTQALGELTEQIKLHLEVLDKISKTLDLLQKDIKKRQS